MPYKQGDIVIVKFPFTNLSGYKQRPAIIVSNENVNKTGDFIVVMLTTQEISGRFATKIGNEHVTTAFKPPHSIMNVYCKKIAVLEECILIRKITEIKDSKKLEEIIKLIKSTF